MFLLLMVFQVENVQKIFQFILTLYKNLFSPTAIRQIYQAVGPYSLNMIMASLRDKKDKSSQPTL